MQKVYGYGPNGKNLQDIIDRVLYKGILLDAALRREATKVGLVNSDGHVSIEIDESYEANPERRNPRKVH